MTQIVAVAPAEGGIGTEHQDLIITLLLKDITQSRDTGEEPILSSHGITAYRNLQGKSAALSEHGTHGPGCTRKHHAAVQLIRRTGEILILLCDLYQLGDTSLFKSSPVLGGCIGGLHGLQENVDEIPFLLRELQLHIFGIHIILIDKIIIHTVTHGGIADHVPENTGLYFQDRNGHRDIQDRDHT